MPAANGKQVAPTGTNNLLSTGQNAQIAAKPKEAIDSDSSEAASDDKQDESDRSTNLKDEEIFFMEHFSEK